MRKTLLMAMVVAAICPMIASAQSAEGYYGGSYVRMSYVKGDVYVQRGQDLGYEQGELNLVVVKGDKIGTKDGRLEIQLGKRNYLRLDNATQVDVVELPASDGEPTKFHLLAGSVFIRVGTLAREKSYEIHTADASFYIMEQGLYRVDVRENRETEFSVWSGSAEAAGEEGSVLVRNQERITAANGRFTSEADRAYARRDGFSEWNETRDALFARQLDKTYLPAEYADYEYDLADNGDWVYENDYGYVWVPRHLYSDWRPYYDGHWSWYPIIGWTWVSYEPWGWCTHHYGRWGWGMNHGWYWIPYDRWAWGPAWVHWYWDRDYVGWCHLSYWNYPGYFYNNRYYDRHSYGRFRGDSRTLTMVHRNQMQDRRLRNVALDQNRLSRIGDVNLRAAQPDVRPSINRDGATAIKARNVLSRESLRNVGQSFNAGGRRLSPAELRSSVSKRAAGGEAAGERKVINDRLRDSSAGRNAGDGSGRVIPRSSVQKDGAGASAAKERDSGSAIRSFPSRRTFENGSADSADRSRIKAPARTEGAAPSNVRRNDGSRESGWPSQGDRAIREVRPKSVEPPANPRSVTPDRVIRERSAAKEGAVTAPRRSLQRESGQRVTAPVERPSRNIVRNDSSSPARQSSSSRISGLPSRMTSSPSRSSSSSSRSVLSPSRITSSPSRRSSSPSRSLTSPSRSSSAPSRITSAPSRSSSSPSRSYSAPSRSSSSPSRSYSAPSRSSGSSSRSSSSSRGSSSRSSSGSGGRIRK